MATDKESAVPQLTQYDGANGAATITLRIKPLLGEEFKIELPSGSTVDALKTRLGQRYKRSSI